MSVRPALHLYAAIVGAKIKITKETGRKDFHVRAISRSYRIRGSLARIHKNLNAKAIVFTPSSAPPKLPIEIVPVKNTAERRLIIKIFIYSDIKIKAKGPPLYSTLKPETNSDSPSLKSKGVRFVSASAVMNHIKKEGLIIKISQ